MKKSILFLLFSTSFLMNMFAGEPISNYIKVSFCSSSGKEEIKQFFISPHLSNDCNAPTALSSGVGVSMDNTGITPGANFAAFVPAIAAPNVQYFSVNAAFFGANNAIGVDIVPGAAPAISNYQVWIMTNCDGTSGTLPATDITNACFAATPASYIIVVVSEAADAGNFTITATSLTTPPTTITVADVSGNTPNDGELCEGDDFTITTTNNITYTYAWQRGATALPNTAFDLTVVNSSTSDAGLYSVTITDANGCSSIVTQNIVVNTLPTVTLNVAETSGNANDDGEVCLGDPFTLTATAGAAAYSWTLDGTPIAGATNTINIASAALANDGVYEVTYEDANGCENTDNITINVNTNPTSSDTELKECGNGATSASFTLTDAELVPNFPATNSNDGADIDNGAAGLTVTYHTTLANANNNVGALASPYATATGTIVFARLENANGCFVTAQVTLTVTVNPTDLQIQNVNNANSPADFTVCQGDQINLTAFVSTGLAPYTYAWTLPNTSTATGISQVVAAANPATHSGIWTVTVTDANGCTDTDDINVTVTPNPANDACGGAIVVNTGNNPGLTNECATQDLTPCAGTINEASVWYSYTIGASVKTLTFTSSSSNHYIKVYENDCTTALSGPCDNTVTLDCPIAQTVKILVSSTSANDGTFGLNITSTATTAANDLCTNAQNIASTPSCQFFAAPSTTTVGACPETFTVAGCGLDYSTEDVVWYEFTTPASTASVEFNNITANAFMTLFSSCPAAAIVPGGGCISGSTSTPINVAANTTYFIAIGINGSTGSVGFDIKYNTPPANDACANSIAVNTGANNGLTNSCATQDLTPCAGTDNQASVWYDYDIIPGVKQLTFTASGANHSIRLYENDCTTPIAGTACGNPVVLDCPLPRTIKIFVSSTTLNAGNFNLTIAQTLTTATNDLCTDAIDIIDPSICKFFPVPASTTVGACPEIFTIAGCGLNYATDAIVWYKFTTPVGTTSINVSGIIGTLSIFDSCPASGGPIAGGGCLTGSPAGDITVTANTTYYVAIGLIGTTGNVGFNLKYNVSLINDNPCVGGFTATTLNGTLAAQDNTCATSDNNCGGNLIDKTVWYSVTVNAPNDKLTVTVTGLTNPSIGLYANGNPCSATVIDEECSGDGTKEFNCLQPGTYNLMIGTSTANAGVFSVTATESVNVAVANDACINATALAIVPTDICVNLGPFTTTNVNACPENIAGAAAPCNFNAEEVVWVSFTAPGTAGQMPTMDFQFTSYSGTGTPFMGVFTDCTTPLGGAECRSGTTVFGNMGPLNAGTTYWIAIGSTGDSGGTFNFTLKFNIGPANDDPCATLPDVSGGGTFTGTTSCAGGDPTLPPCPLGDQQNVVFYKFTVGANSKGVDVSITPSGATPFSGGIVAGVVQNACPGPGTYLQTECSSGSLMKKFECLPPGDYFLQISTSGATAGDFTLTVTQIANNAPTYDICSKAETINVLECDWVTATGTTVNACFETFSAGGCAHNLDPTVYMQFTTPAGTTEVDFRNIPAGTYMSLLTDCTPTSVLGCSNDLNPFENIPVTGNTTYYLAVSSTNPAGTAYTFDVRVIVPPANDCTPEVIPSGGSPSLTSTCCATNPGEPGSACPAGNQQSTVWFEYQPDPMSKAVKINFTNTSMTGNINVEVFIGAPGQNCAGGFAVAPGTTPYCIAAGNAEFTVRCVDFAANSIYVKVGSSELGCGDFGLAFDELASCDGADLCAEATNFQVLMPVTDGACDSGTFCNEGSCAETGDCDANGASTWVLIETDPQATVVVINISGATFTPIISAYSGGCGGAEVVSCEQVSTINLAPVNNMVAVKIEAQNGVNLGNFTIEACALGLTFDCHDSGVIITRPEHPTADPAGPFCPGETVTMCFDIDFIVSSIGSNPPDGNNCQWIQGIIPTFSTGWDVLGSNLPGQAPGTSAWFPEASVQYNGNNNIANIVTLPGGELGLQVGGGTPLMNGTELPAGWWYTSNGGGPLCTNDGDPDNMWGLPGGCGSTQMVNFCLNVKVKELTQLTDCEAENLNFNLFIFADGETGCWSNMSCALALPVEFVGDIDCSGNITVEGDDKQICSGDNVLIEVVASQSGATINLNTIDNPNVTGETLTGSFPNSIASFTDILVNTGTNIEIVTYVFSAQGANSICEGPPFELMVTVYPNLDVQFPPIYVCDGLCTSISPNVTGGSGVYVSYDWSNGASGPSITVCPTTNTTYFVTVTDDKGCIGTGEVEVEVKPKVDGSLDPDPLVICQDDVEDIGPYIVVNMTSGNDPYTYTWNFPGGIFGVQGTTNYDGDTYEIEEENSVPGATPRDYSVNIVDVFGCEVTLEGMISIDGAPELTFTYPPVTCGQNSVILKATFDFGQSSSGLDKFELYDCADNLIATKNNNPSFFTIADLSTNNCFVLKAITDNGCISSKSLVVNPPVGTQALLDGTSPICRGQNSTISISNVAAFVNPTFAWSNGLTGPNITVGPLTSTIYVVTVTEPSTGCTDEANFEVVVNQKPVIDIVGSTSFCVGSSTTIQANSDIPGSTFVWSGAGTSTTNSVLINTAGSLTLVVTSPTGCAKDTTFNVQSSTSLTVNLNDLALCDNGIDTLTSGNFFSTYKWAKDGVEIVGETTSKLPVSSSGLYTVSVSDASGCTGVGTKNVTNSPSPNANVLINPIDVCRVNSGVGPTFIDFTTLVSGSPGTWAEILHPGNAGFSTVSLTNISNVSFLGEDRDTFRFQFVTNTAIAPCENDTVFVDVLVNNCPCPSINFEPAEVCNDETQPVDLNKFLKVPAIIRDGKWTLTGGPSSPIITNDTLIDVNGIAPGVYNLNWVTNLSIGACPNSGAHTLTVNDAPTANIKGDRFVCNANTALGASSIDLDSILVAGSNTGTWVQTAGTTVTLGAGNILNGIGLNPGILTFEYTTNDAVAPCKEAKVTLQITVRDCNCPLATIDIDTLCNGSGTVNLSTLIKIDPVGTSGTWSSTAVGAVKGNTFDATGITSGAYKIRFTLTTDPGGSCAKFFEQDIVLRRQPTAEQNIDGNPCNVASGSGVTTLNLFSLLKAGYTPGGAWTQVSGPTTLTIPGNAILDFVGLTPGDVYTFKYDLDALDPCVPVSAVVKATVKDCNCPNVDLLPPSDICNSELVYDLSLLQDPGIAPGIWTVLSPLNVSITVNGNKTFDIQTNGTSLAPGKYKLRYTLDPAPGGTCAKFNEVILTIIENKTATLKASEMVCNTDKGNNDTKIDFRTLIEQNSFFGGTWVKPANFPGSFTDVTNVDFKDLPVGDKYTFTYKIDNADPCEDYEYKIVIEVIDCACPPIKPTQPKDVCGAAGSLDLTQYNDPANPGDWTSNELTITNNKADLNNLASGNYKLTYRIKNPLPNCPDSVALVLTVVKPKNIGTATPKDICSNEGTSIKLGDQITGEDTGGTWKEISLKPSTASAFNATAGTFNTNGQAAGSYIFEYIFANQTPCPDSKQTVTINIISAPTAQAGNPAILDCNVADVSIGDPTDNQPNVKYEWTHDGGQVVPNADKATTKVNFGGKFTIKVTNTLTGCTTTDDVLITVDPNKPIAVVDVKNVSCFNKKDGSISFTDIKGGKAPLQFSNNGGSSFQSSPNFNSLNGGNYKMLIKDATGCTFIEDVVLTEPAPFSINIGNDTTITLGASLDMDLLNQINAGAKSIKWTMTDSAGIKTICDKPLDECIEITVSPIVSTTVCAMAVDNNGCIAEDCRLINLLRARNVVFSNILNPTLGGDNNTFFPKSNSIGWVNKMSVYDRWGNLMFTRNDFAANDPSLGWNGTFNGKDVVPGVYTWVVELEYDAKGSGDLEIFKGDVTVIQ